jgi:hypothetical protein
MGKGKTKWVKIRLPMMTHAKAKAKAAMSLMSFEEWLVSLVDEAVEEPKDKPDKP